MSVETNAKYIILLLFTISNHISLHSLLALLDMRIVMLLFCRVVNADDDTEVMGMMTLMFMWSNDEHVIIGNHHSLNHVKNTILIKFQTPNSIRPYIHRHISTNYPIRSLGVESNGNWYKRGILIISSLWKMKVKARCYVHGEASPFEIDRK